MKKAILFLSFIFLQLFYVSAQIEINWASCFGGVSYESPQTICQTFDGGYIIAGETDSNDGDVSGNHGDIDYWIVKLGSSGYIEWQKCLGGSDWEEAPEIQQTSDGGFILVGSSWSKDGDVTGNHGEQDYWVVKLNSLGDIEWEKSLGGSTWDKAESIQQTTDGGFILAGSTHSNDGNVSGNHGGNDYWVVKLSYNGNIEWQKCYGGSESDEAKSIQQTLDGGYIVAGSTYSDDGDVSGIHSSDYSPDCWIVKLNSYGIIEWQKCLGGTGYENSSNILETLDGNYILASYTNSNDGDVSGNHGNIDYWIVKLNTSGNIIWQKCLGGIGADYTSSITRTTDGSYIISGFTYSNDGDVSGNHGGNDYWIVKLESSGDIEWQKCLGGSGHDYAQSIQQTSDGGFIVAGAADSNDGDVSGNHGGRDYWIVKLCQKSPLSIEIENPTDCYNTLTAIGDFDSFLWSTGDTARSINITEGGTYSVSAINLSGCTSEASIDADTPTPLPISIDIVNPNYCFSTELNAEGEFIDYLWSTGDTTQSITILNGGVYQVTGYGENECHSESVFDAPNPVEPYGQSEICMVTLNEEIDKNIIIYEPVEDVGIDSILIYRLNNLTSEYEWIGSNSINSTGMFVDQESLPAQQNYQYKIEIRDTCGRTSNLSELHQTMLLQSNVGINNEVNLFWNAYKGFDYPNFGIYRSNNGGDYILIANVPNNTYTFIDLFPPSGESKYQIRVERADPCIPNKSDFSYVASNAIILKPSAINEYDSQNIKIYPNPFEESFTVERGSPLVEMDVELVDAYGRVRETTKFFEGDNTMTVSTDKLSSGVYYLRFDHLFVRRIVKK